MELLIQRNRASLLQNADDFKKFHAEVRDPTMEDREILAALGPGAESAGEAEFWISADHVRALAGRAADPDWQRNFTTMLETVRPYGWSSDDLTRIRVHVKRL